YKAIRPAHPVVAADPASVGLGAFQVAARVSVLRIEDDFVDLGLIAPASYPRAVRSYDVGLNWSPIEYAKVQVHALRTTYDREAVIGGDSRDSEDALLLQFQVAF